MRGRTGAGGVLSRLPRCEAGRSGRPIRSGVTAAAEIRLLPGAAPKREESAPGVVLPPPPGAVGCARFVRRRVAARLPELCEALIDQALAGDLQAAKLLWQMAELDKTPAGAAGRKKTVAGLAQKALAEFRAR